MYFGNIALEGINKEDKKLLHALLAASKKAVTRRWIKPEQPTTEDWIDIRQEIYTLVKMSFSLKL